MSIFKLNYDLSERMEKEIQSARLKKWEQEHKMKNGTILHINLIRETAEWDIENEYGGEEGNCGCVWTAEEIVVDWLMGHGGDLFNTFWEAKLDNPSLMGCWALSSW